MNPSHDPETLRAELATIETELGEIAVKDPATGQYHATVADMDATATESDEVADKLEEMEERQSEVHVLNTRRNEILALLEGNE